MKDLASGAIELLEPSARETGGSVRYVDAEPYFRGTDADSAEAIESMARRGFLIPTSSRTVHRCPDCDAQLDDSSTVCSDCASSDVVKRDVLEHPACGCTKPRTKFEGGDGDEYRCPDCAAVVRAIGVDYAKVGEFHACTGCEELFDALEKRFVCDRCSTAFAEGETNEVELTAYRINDERTEWLETHRFARREIGRKLRERGFSVELDATVTGRSGHSHDVDLYATDETFGFDVTAFVREELLDEYVLRFHAIASDTGSHAVLITPNEPTEDAIALAGEFGVQVVSVPVERTPLDAGRRSERRVEQSSVN